MCCSVQSFPVDIRSYCSSIDLHFYPFFAWRSLEVDVIGEVAFVLVVNGVLLANLGGTNTLLCDIRLLDWGI